MSRNKGFFLWFTVLLTLEMVGCSIDKMDETKQNDIEYTVVAPQDIPEEMEIIKNSEKPFEITYSDNVYLYASQGYGKQKSSGYSISIESCYESENTIYIKTKLIGPKQGELITKEPTYPYVVLKMEYSEKEVVFQ